MSIAIILILSSLYPLYPFVLGLLGAHQRILQYCNLFVEKVLLLQDVQFPCNEQGEPCGVVCFRHCVLLRSNDPRKSAEQQVEEFKASQGVKGKGGKFANEILEADQLQEQLPKHRFNPASSVMTRSAQRSLPKQGTRYRY